MRYVALEEAFSIPELDARQAPPWPENRFSVRSLADWGRRLPDFTEFRLPEMDAAGIDVQVLSLTVPGLQGEQDAPAARSDAGWPTTTWRRPSRSIQTGSAASLPCPCRTPRRPPPS